jgi:hypothetical protein
MIGLVSSAALVSRGGTTSKGSVSMSLSIGGRTVLSVTVVSTVRPIILRFYDADEELIHEINHPADTTTTYDVSAHSIPVVDAEVTRANATIRYSFGPKWAALF